MTGTFLLDCCLWRRVVCPKFESRRNKSKV